MLFSPFAIPIVAILAVFGYLAVQAVADAICASRKHRLDAELKIALAQRGMSAAEIERVVAATAGGGGKEFPPTNEKSMGENPMSERATPSYPLPPRKQTAPTGL